MKLIFSGIVNNIEMATWLTESRIYLDEMSDGFCVFVDMRKLVPLDEVSKNIIAKGQRLYRKKRMLRSVVVLNSPVLTVQFRQIAHETGIYEWERYIDASHNTDWEQQALNWLMKSIDPDIYSKEATKTD